MQKESLSENITLITLQANETWKGGITRDLSVVMIDGILSHDELNNAIIEGPAKFERHHHDCRWCVNKACEEERMMA